ncbi:peptidase [Allochromatium humboldtianum]|uniref:Peptidase n=1 Tax=Allochromatium humboldtianum TaxID=504901 RepID=A0A850RFB4_9GAMM|nr:metallopeptidase TldD-related protein [Allochromatium humboldtianum]NVZ07823.1 peptidase [Allochromatium humboldtianum]
MTPDAFFALAERLSAGLTGDEVLFCNLGGEVSDFVRLNRNRVRQAGNVRAAGLTLTLIAGARQAEAAFDLSGDPEADLALGRTLIGRLRERLAVLPDDPYLQYATEPSTGVTCQESQALPPAEEAVATLIEAAEGLDLVGIWAGGLIQTGLASSLGHRHWHERASFNLDWSVYLSGDKALKSSYSGFDWNPDVVHERLRTMRAGLEILRRPARRLDPGRYRAYLAPPAVEELMGMLAWGGFDLRDHRTQQTPLLKLVRGERAFDPRITLREDHARGLTPGFTPEGFILPPSVTLIDAGAFGDCLVDARSGREYGEPVNAASGSPESLSLEPGDLPESEVLARLDTGLWIGHLWYCNWSDPNEARVTGMTRFGTFWVEGGEIRCPVEVMRFDDSLYALLGTRLEALTRERELRLSPETYEGRSSASALLPGVLVSGIELTL